MALRRNRSGYGAWHYDEVQLAVDIDLHDPEEIAEYLRDLAHSFTGGATEARYLGSESIYFPIESAIANASILNRLAKEVEQWHFSAST